MSQCLYCPAEVSQQANCCPDCAKRLLAGENLQPRAPGSKPETAEVRKPSKFGVKGTSGTSNAARTLAWAREQGWIAAMVEKWQGSFAERDVINAARRYVDTGDTVAIRQACFKLNRSGPGRRIDLWGWIDILCIDPETGIIGLQACSDSTIAAHVKKIQEAHIQAPYDEKVVDPAAWLKHARLLVVGWKKHAKPVNRRYWRPRIVEITAKNLKPATP